MGLIRRNFLFLFAFIFLFVACGRDSNNLTFLDDPTQESAEPSARQLTDSEIEKLARFRDSDLSELQSVEVLSHYSHLDPNKEVPKKLLKTALLYFDKNRDLIENKNFITVVDFKFHSAIARLFIIDMRSGAVWKLHVAHGSGSDKNNDGVAEMFSNVSGSHASSVGFYLTNETYVGTNGLSLRLDGLSQTNSNVRARAVVIHGAKYVFNTDDKPGRSWGCLAVPMVERDKVVETLKEGSLIYAAVSS